MVVSVASIRIHRRGANSIASTPQVYGTAVRMSIIQSTSRLPWNCGMNATGRARSAE